MDSFFHGTRDAAGGRFRTLGVFAAALGLGVLALAAAFVEPGVRSGTALMDIVDLAQQDPAAQDPAAQDPASKGGAKLDSSDNAVALAKATLDKLVEARRNIASARRDWALGKEMLTDRIALMKRNIADLQTNIDEIEANIGTADEKRSALVDENEGLKRSVASLAERIGAFEQRMSALLPRLPDPIRQKVEPLSQRLPKPDVETKFSLGERYSTVVGILNEVDKFHQEVTIGSEVRELSDGRTAEVTAMYVGIAYGFFVNAAGDAAGIGTAGPEGWTWAPADDAAPVIARAIAIVEGREPAAFVALPLEIR